MQRCSAVVRHAGNLAMTIHKENLTPAEIVLLRMIHGDDAVVQITVTAEEGANRRGDNSPVRELKRLRDLYGAKLVGQAWPGINPMLPVTLEQAGIRLADDAETDDPDFRDEFDGEGDAGEAEAAEDLGAPVVAPPDAVMARVKARGLLSARPPVPAGQD